MKKILLILFIFLAGYQIINTRQTKQPEGMLVRDAPIQKEITPKPLTDKITAAATYEIEARVLSKKSYTLGKEADFSPIDLTLGWQEMSSNEWLSKVEISQGNRFYFWKILDKEFYNKKDRIRDTSANVHMVPATSDIKSSLKSVKVGDIVLLKGYLVSIKDGRWLWRSSMTRTDMGAGACELFYVEEVEIR